MFTFLQLIPVVIGVVKSALKKLQGLVIVKMKLEVKTWNHPVQIPQWSESGVGKEDHCPEKHKFLSWSHKKTYFCRHVQSVFGVLCKPMKSVWLKPSTQICLM